MRKCSVICPPVCRWHVEMSVALFPAIWAGNMPNGWVDGKGERPGLLGAYILNSRIKCLFGDSWVPRKSVGANGNSSLLLCMKCEGDCLRFVTVPDPCGWGGDIGHPVSNFHAETLQ